MMYYTNGNCKIIKVLLKKTLNPNIKKYNLPFFITLKQKTLDQNDKNYNINIKNLNQNNKKSTCPAYKLCSYKKSNYTNHSLYYISSSSNYNNEYSRDLSDYSNYFLIIIEKII